MAELLIRVVDRNDPDDAERSAICEKAGDVIVVQPDGWKWSHEETTSPLWVIVKVPGVEPSVFADLLAMDDVPVGALARFRRRALDLTRPVLQNALQSGNRVFTFTGLQKDALLAARKTKDAFNSVITLR